MISQSDAEKPKKVVEFLLYMFPHIYSDGVYDLNFQILPTGVFDTLFDLALLHTRELIAQSVNPLVVGGTICQNPNFSDKEMSSILTEISHLVKRVGKQGDKLFRAPVRIFRLIAESNKTSKCRKILHIYSRIHIQVITHVF
jgi:hypothetical protein